MMKRLLIMALASVFMTVPQALAVGATAEAELQQAKKTVSGVVTDADGRPVIGAVVMVPGTTVGTVTDEQGRFTLSVPEGVSTLEVTNIGFKPQRITVNGTSGNNVRLYEDSQMLEETVFVGYGVQKKSNLTGAITSVKSDEIVDLPVTSISEALQGKVSGVAVTQSKGVGQAASIQIRGAGSTLHY